MQIRIITPRVHGVLDFVLAATLVAVPLFVDLGSTVATWMSILGGVGLVGYSLLTGYAAGLKKLIPFRVHLALDFSAGVAFAVAPLLFGFSPIAWWFYFAVAATVMSVVALSEPDPVIAPVR